MIYIIIPLLIMAAMGISCLNFKAGFWVSDHTEGSGFSMGFYMMTIFGLFAAEISFAAYILNTLNKHGY